MTVAELIKILQSMPGSLPIEVGLMKRTVPIDHVAYVRKHDYDVAVGDLPLVIIQTETL